MFAGPVPDGAIDMALLLPRFMVRRDLLAAELRKASRKASWSLLKSVRSIM
jgi:hypothetical protein